MEEETFQDREKHKTFISNTTNPKKLQEANFRLKSKEGYIIGLRRRKGKKEMMYLYYNIKHKINNLKNI